MDERIDPGARRSDLPSHDDSFAHRLQRIDEQLAGERPTPPADQKGPSTRQPVDEQTARAKGVLELINLVRSFASETSRDGEDDDTSLGDNPLLDRSEDSFSNEAVTPCVGFRIADFVIEEEIARGGMGIVFRARDLNLNRTVALKVLLAGPFAQAEDRIRFRGEAEAAARLDHPGIVPVYEVGDRDGILYFTMGLVEGTSLSQIIRQSPLDPTRAAEMAIEIAAAAEYAHAKGIVHRDLKPANVLIDQSGRVRVTDFGLARQTDSGSDLTRTGQVVGTPEYMAPEQACGHASEAGPSADIYSIGATLYCMLTGHPPFWAANSVETLRRVIEQDPVSLRQFNRKIPVDLETICLRCLEKQPDQRYPNAAALCWDLRQFLAGEPIAARRPTLVQRTIRLARRYPWAAACVGLLFALAILGPIIATNQMRLAGEARQARDEMARTLYISDMNLAMRDWDEANLQRCGELLLRHLPQQGKRDFRGFEWYYLYRAWRESQDVPVIFRDIQLECMALSPDQSKLAIGGHDGQLVIWDLNTDRELHRFQAHPYRTCRVAFSCDSQILASASIDNEVALWDCQTAAPLRSLSGSRAISFSPVDRAFAYRTAGRAIGILNAISADPLIIENADPDFIETLEFSHDGQRIASAGWDGHIRIWDATTGQLMRTLDGHQQSVWAVAWSPDGRFLASGDSTGGVSIWNTDNARRISGHSDHESTINSIAFSSDGQWLASASGDNTVHLRSVKSGRLLQVLKGHSAAVHSLSFATDGTFLMTASIDGTVKRWELDRASQPDLLEHPCPVNSVVFLDNGRTIATAGIDGNIRYWDLADGTLRTEVSAHQGAVWRIAALQVDGQPLLISSGQDEHVRVWDRQTHQCILKLNSPPRSLDPLPIAVFAGDSLVAFSDKTHNVAVWDLRNRKQLASYKTGRVEDLDFSPDGRFLLSALGPFLEIRDSRSGDLLLQWEGASRVTKHVRFSPDGRKIAAATHNQLVKLWQRDDAPGALPENLTSPRVLTGSAGIVDALNYSHDGTVLATAGDDRVIRIWDAETDQQRAVLVGHSAEIVALAFSPDDQILASASMDSTVRLWRAPRNESFDADRKEVSRDPSNVKSQVAEVGM